MKRETGVAARLSPRRFPKPYSFSFLFTLSDGGSYQVFAFIFFKGHYTLLVYTLEAFLE